MSDKTRFLARLIGLYCLIVALVMALQREAWTAAVTTLVQEPPLMLMLGVCVVAAGLAIVVAHNVWSGGVLPVVVTVIGWLTLLKGLMLWMLTPAVAVDLYLERLHYADLYYLYCAFSCAIGLYLVIAGFAARGRAPSGRG